MFGPRDFANDLAAATADAGGFGHQSHVRSMVAREPASDIFGTPVYAGSARPEQASYTAGSALRK